MNDTYFNAKSEELAINSALTVEHILPQNWVERWPLPDGSRGLSSLLGQLGRPHDDPQVQATRRRNAILQTFGNLTILTQALNSSVSNSQWKDKKPALLTASLLPINQQLHAAECWYEAAIEERSKQLFERALKLWPGPPVHA